MRGAFVPYRSLRPLRGLRLGALGEGAASDASAYLNYAKALYQAYKGDVAGGAYNAAITAAGPIAAIGAAIATFANRKGARDDALISAFVDAMIEIGFGKMMCGGGKTGTTYPLVTPDGAMMLNAGGDEILQVARAIGNGMDSGFVGEKFKAWLATGRPVMTNAVCHIVQPPRPIADPVPEVTPVAPAPVIVAAPVMVPTPTPTSVLLPTPTPTPAPILTLAPVPSLAPPAIAAPTILPAVAQSPAITVNLPSSVPPDQTPALIQAALNQGASAQQAMIAALHSLAARGVPSSAPVVKKVAADVSSVQKPSTGVIVLAAGAAAVILLGVLFSRGS